MLTKRLEELEVLEDIQAQVSLTTGEQISLGGVAAVNRDRLRALAPDVLHELAQDDWLELIYIHLVSLANFSSLMDRFAAVRNSGTEADNTE